MPRPFAMDVRGPVIYGTDHYESYFVTVKLQSVILKEMLDLEKVYEALLYWRGNLNAPEFADAVGRARQRVQEDIITPFVKDRAADLQNVRGRKHGRTLTVRPKSAPDGLWSFFGLLAAERKWRRRERPGHSSLAGLDVVDLAPPEPANAAVWICRAAAQKRVIVGHYMFKRHGARPVRFSPHAMVRTPRRIHFRGHLLVHAADEIQDWGYVDLVPGRFLDDGDLQLALDDEDRRVEDSGYRGAQGDRDWHELTRLVFQVNPALPPHAFFALQQEHGLETDHDGRCRLELLVRRALVHSYEHHVFDRTIGPERMKAWVRIDAVD